MERLTSRFDEVAHKVNLLNNGHLHLKRNIQSEFETISSQIRLEADARKNELTNLEAKLQNDIKLRLYEILFDLKQKYEMNESAEDFRKQVNKRFQSVEADLKCFNDTGLTQKHDDDKINNLLNKLEEIATIIDDNQKLMALPIGEQIVTFTKSKNQIEIPVIGEINYERTFKLDVVNQIKNLNDRIKMIYMDLNKMFKDSYMSRRVSLLNKNKVFYMFEKIHGRIKTTNMFILYYDMTILRQCEIDHHLETFVTHAIYDKLICLCFRKGKKDFLIKMYDIDLNFVRESFIDFEVTKVKMNATRIYCINEYKTNNCIKELDFNLNVLKTFGQRKREKSSYYVKGDVIALNDNKIFIKAKTYIKVLSYTTGKLLYSFEVTDLDECCEVFLDFHTEKFIVFNGFERLSYYNHSGNLIITNKLRLTEQKFDQFQYTVNGNFAFVNTEMNYLVIV